MAFAFRQITISGSNILSGVEGTSAGINVITDVMVNEMGWIIEEDRRDQAGNNSLALTHKIVLHSNGGESGDQANWYLTLTSGTNSGFQQDLIGSMVHTAYDTGTHLTPGSGVDTTTTHVNNTIATSSIGLCNLWISGDKDGVVIVTESDGATMAWFTAGKSNHFLSDQFEPYGVYHYSVINSTAIDATQVDSIGGNPPEQFLNESEFLTPVSPGSLNSPRSLLGPGQGEFVLLPVLHTLDDNSPSRGGPLGFVKHFWRAPNAGSLYPGVIEFAIEGTSNRYLIFSSTNGIGLAIRKS